MAVRKAEAVWEGSLKEGAGVMELIKQGELELYQEATFGVIQLLPIGSEETA